MTRWIEWTAPTAVVLSVGSAAHAVQYLTIPDAQRRAFPSATNFSVVQTDRIWRAESGGSVIGFFIFDRVIGKHLYIDYAVALDASGRIHQVDILEYRESYGGEIRSASWLAQFVGKSSSSPFQVGNDIRNISGATLSCHHVTEGIKRIMSIAGRPQIAFAGRGHCSERSLKSRLPVVRRWSWRQPSKRHSARWSRCTAS